MERAEHVISPDACPKTPPHLDEFDPSYLRNYVEDVVEKRANDTGCARTATTLTEEAQLLAASMGEQMEEGSSGVPVVGAVWPGTATTS